MVCNAAKILTGWQRWAWGVARDRHGQPGSIQRRASAPQLGSAASKPVALPVGDTVACTTRMDDRSARTSASDPAVTQGTQTAEEDRGAERGQSSGRHALARLRSHPQCTAQSTGKAEGWPTIINRVGEVAAHVGLDLKVLQM